MTYDLHFHPLALKEWNKLDRDIATQFKKTLRRRLTQPHVPRAALGGQLKHCYKIKLRELGYRLVYSVNDHELIVLVVAGGKRDRNKTYHSAIARAPRVASTGIPID